MPQPDSEAKERALEELLDLVLADAQLAAICREFGIERSHLEQYYHAVRLYGGEHWERGAFVCAAAIATAPTLRYVVSSAQATLPSDWTEQDRWLSVTTTLCEYYRNGTLGPVPLSPSQGG